MARWWIGLATLALSSVTHAGGPTPAEIGRSLVDVQLAAINDPAALVASLPPDAIIVGNGSVTLANATNATNATAIVTTLSASPRSLSPVLQAKITRLDAGGTSDVVWLSADVILVHRMRGGRGSLPADVTSARLLELAVTTGTTWKVVALSFTSTSNATVPGEALAAAGTGPLTALLGSPYKLDGALRDDATTIVHGAHDELAIGHDDARRILAPWRYRDAKVTTALEVRTKAWGVAIGDVVIAGDPHLHADPPAHVRMLVFAIPDGARWKVVGVSALAPDASIADANVDPLSRPAPTIQP
jgi:hypothetical protein